MQFEMIGKTDIGKQRSRNEDHYLILENFELTAIADGMGGHIDGNIASEIAVNVIEKNYTEKFANIAGPDPEDKSIDLKKQEKFLVETIKNSNTAIFEKNAKNFAFQGMGSTVVALQICGDHILTACVGDSRIYLQREDKLIQLTSDHSLVGELLRHNVIKEKELGYFQNKNIITRALGMAMNVLVDTNTYEIQPGDIFLLCSDGLSDLVTDDEICRLIVEGKENMESLADSLVQKANDNGGDDNITVTLVKINA